MVGILSEEKRKKMQYLSSVLKFKWYYSAKSLRKMFEKHIAIDAKITTDKWKGYNPIAKDYHLTQILSDKGLFRLFPFLQDKIFIVIPSNKKTLYKSRELSFGWKTGFEPATSGTTIRRSNQLSYNHHLLIF